MNAACFPLMTVFVIDRKSLVGTHLFGRDGKGLLLFYDRCGADPKWPLVDSCDEKHFVKRFREAVGRPQGVKIRVHTFDKKLLSRLLEDVGYEKGHIDTMFGIGEEDKQNVSAAVQLLLALGCFRFKTPVDFSAERRSTPHFASVLAELKILSIYAAAMFSVVTMQSSDPKDPGGTFIPLEQLDRSISKMAHISFVLYRANLSDWVPPQHYYNTQITLRAKYISQAVSKAEGIANYWSYQVCAAAPHRTTLHSPRRTTLTQALTLTPLRWHVGC